MLARQGTGEDLLEVELLAELDTADLRLEVDQISAQAATVADAIEKLIVTNTRVAQNQSDYQRRFEKLSAEHTELRVQHGALLSQISDRQNQAATCEHLKTSVADLDRDQIEFTPYLWHPLTDSADVGTDGTVTFTSRDGSEWRVDGTA